LIVVESPRGKGKETWKAVKDVTDPLWVKESAPVQSLAQNADNGCLTDSKSTIDDYEHGM
jgi:hypothetical protein